jgi:hypothetical protein
MRRLNESIIQVNLSSAECRRFAVITAKIKGTSFMDFSRQAPLFSAKRTKP